jgi:orotate phosphoribosyltransferase
MNSTQKVDLAKEIYDACYLTGNFVLRSGRKTTEYFDKYQLSAKSSLLYEITKGMAALIPDGIEVIAGLEMGAIPVVTMLAHHTGIPAAFVRKQAKPHGTARLAEGASIEGKNVLVIEDVVTSGGQVVISTGDMRALGAKIAHALVIIDRQDGGAEALKKIGVNLISLFNKSDFDQAEAV